MYFRPLRLTKACHNKQLSHNNQERLPYLIPSETPKAVRSRAWYDIGGLISKFLVVRESANAKRRHVPDGGRSEKWFQQHGIDCGEGITQQSVECTHTEFPRRRGPKVDLELGRNRQSGIGI